MKRHWQILRPDPECVKKLSHSLKCHPVTAAVLINRRIISEKEAFDFLHISLKNIRSPFGLKDMDAAVSRIYAALAGNEKILVFGDYDVDGITATAILLDFLRSCGADVSYYIPHRIQEGYGLQVRHLTDCAHPNGIGLIITADCGSASAEAVVKARQIGIDVIITDHHNIPANIPTAVAVINPKRPDCSSGLDHLAGVGVAFALLICLRKYLRDRHFWHNRPEPNLKNLCDLVALGTIADMVPLTRENRIFSRTGLDLINSGCRSAIAALLEAAGIARHCADADDIAFRLAPRLNAAGRLQHASAAVDLLITEDADRARQMAESLTTLNQKRRELEKEIFDGIRAHLKKNPELLQRRTLVLWNSQWHEGVLGIVASRMVKKYYRPVVLFAVKGEIAKGSGRSIPEIDLYQRLSACKHALENFGGHSMAAGLSLKIENLKLFQQRFEEEVDQWSHPEDLMPKLHIDSELALSEISDRLIDELESLAPFGTGNPEPVFMARNVTVASSKIVGGNHRRMVLRQAFGSTGTQVSAIHFNVESPLLTQESFDQVAFRLRWNRWNGKKTAQLVFEDT
jgi:single-stranded-DNA-specific exonuclease